MLQTAPNPIFAQGKSNEIVHISEDNAWQLNIPGAISAYSSELESLLDKVFKNCPRTEQNIDLAKQLAINWCTSKCKELDIPVDSCLGQLTL